MRRLDHARLAAGLSTALLVGGLAVSAPPASAEIVPHTVSFTTVGEHTFKVPASVTTVHVVAVAGNGAGASTTQGLGKAATADLAVTPGTTLYLEVGGNGSFSAGGANGGGDGGFSGDLTDVTSSGGGGGGATDVRLAPVSDPSSLGSRVLIAGGGGGAPANGAGVGGNGGGTTGTDGTTGGVTIPGYGATQSQGGSGGIGCGWTGSSNGSLGIGGTGGGAYTSDNAGGGGGGGLYGGGGGSCDAGGGGGSGYFGPATSNTSVAAGNGSPSITLNYVTTVVTPPPNTKITRTTIRKARHSATFRFAAVGSALRFQCKLKKAGRAATFRSCTSPKTYQRLTRGGYTFFVRAIGPDGPDPTPARYSFRI